MKNHKKCLGGIYVRYQCVVKANEYIEITMLNNIAFIDVVTVGEVYPKLDNKIIGKSIIS